MLLGILSLVLTGSFWVALGIVISKSAQKDLDLKFIQGAAGILVVLPALPVLPFSSLPDLLSSCLLLLAGAGNYCIFNLMNKAMKIGPNGLTWAMIQSAFVMPFIMGIVFFAVPCPGIRLAGIVLLLTATALMGLSGGKQGGCGFSRKWLLLTVTGFVLAGLNQCCANLPSYLLKQTQTDGAGLLIRTGISGAGTAAVWFFPCLAGRKKILAPNCVPGILTMAAGTVAATVTLFFGLDRLAAAGAGAVGYPVAMGVTIMMFQIYTAVILREKLSLSGALSIFLCLAGIGCLIAAE